MTDTRKLLKVFLASPGDLGEERKIAKAVVDEFNALLAENFGYHVELVGWEDTVSVFGRPQATINKDLDRCELFIGLMWKHWGTPPDTSGLYTSGFEEEFRRSVDRRIRDGRPEISLLFKEVDPELIRDPGAELKKVLAFKKQLIAEKQVYFEHFADARAFETKIRRCITKYVVSLKTREADQSSDQNQERPGDGQSQQRISGTSSPLVTPLSTEGAKFLREFVSKTERDLKKDPISSAEVARFRLLGSLITTPENDKDALGVHDANVLFAEASGFNFGNAEFAGLIGSGLAHYRHENVPLWRWYTAADGFRRNLLSLYSLFGPEEQRTGALIAMRVIGAQLGDHGPDDRSRFIDTWLSSVTPRSVRSAALTYLADFGIAADLPAIRQEFDRNDTQTASAAVDAIIRINLRVSRKKAIEALCELQPSSINNALLRLVFADAHRLSDELLLTGTSHKNAAVRKITSDLLQKRSALPAQIAERLLLDDDANVRLIGLRSLEAEGKTYSDEEAKRILIKPRQRFGLFGDRDREGEERWEEFKEDRLRSMKDKDLEAESAQASIYNRSPFFILAKRQFARHSNALRTSIDNQYKSEFEQEIARVSNLYGEDSDTTKATRAVEEHVRKNLTRSALDIICANADVRDLGRIRNALNSGYVEYSDLDIQYLSKFGEWEDIPLIISSIERLTAGHTSLLISERDDSKYRLAAQAMLNIGKGRYSDLLEIPAPSKLLLYLIVEAPNKTFRSLSDGSIVSILLRCETDAVRKAAVLKSILSLPKGRLYGLLTDYVSGSKQRYYNVVHWLDFGLSVSRELASSSAKKLIASEWRSQ